MYRWRWLVVGGAVLLVTLVASFNELHRMIMDLFVFAEGFIAKHPHWGMLLFVALAVLSAMMAFVSSAIVVPIGVQVWGMPGCLLLLWLGWLLGGVLSYGIGRYLGRRAVTAFVSEKKIASYESRITAHLHRRKNAKVIITG